MANEAILRAYLVSIGFKVDEEAYKKFKDKLQDADKRSQDLRKNFEEFGKFALGWAATFTTAALVVASKMEQIGFAARRAGTSAKNLQAFEFGARSIGLSAEEARSSLEGMAMAVRLNPGLMGLMTGMGINPREDRVQMMLDLVDRLKTMPFAVGARVGEMFGIDPQTLLMLEQGTDELKKNMKARQDMAAQTGTDADQMAAKSHSFMQNVRGLEERFEIFTDLAATKLLPQMEKLTDQLSNIVDLLLKADKATSGWSSAIGGIALALGSFLGSLGILRGALGMLGIGGGAAAGGATAGGIGAGALGTAALGTLGTVAGVAGVGLETFLNSPTLQEKLSAKVLAGKGNGFENWFYNLIYGAPMDTTNAPRDAIMNRGGTPLHNPGNLRSAPGVGTVERFRGGTSIGRFAQFGSDEEGLRAMANLLEGPLYFGGGLDTISKIVNKYAPAKENDVGAYVADVSKRMGMAPGAHLSLADPGVLTSLMSAMIHHEQGKDPFSLSTIEQAAKFRLGAPSGGLVFQQKTDIHVNGAGDPLAVGNAVAGQQSRVNGDLVRNLGATVK